MVPGVLEPPIHLNPQGSYLGAFIIPILQTMKVSHR